MSIRRLLGENKGNKLGWSSLTTTADKSLRKKGEEEEQGETYMYVYRLVSLAVAMPLQFQKEALPQKREEKKRKNGICTDRRLARRGGGGVQCTQPAEMHFAVRGRIGALGPRPMQGRNTLR